MKKKTILSIYLSKLSFERVRIIVSSRKRKWIDDATKILY